METKFKFKDNAGNRFIVYAKNRLEAIQEAKRRSLSTVVYIID